MNMISMTKRMAVAAVLMAATLQSFAYNNIWVRAEAQPTGAGLVYVDWNNDVETPVFDDASEFKRSANSAASTAFIWTQVEPGYQLAGFVRDNGNQVYDNGVDLQLRVRPDGFFTAVYDHTEYGGAGSSSSAQAEAEAALEDMENPTDLVFAVFTQGDIARPAEGQENFGWVYCNKLDNEPGDEIVLDAYGDSDNSEGPVRYYKFDHWTDSYGEIVSTERYLHVTVNGGEVYYAHFVETTKEERDVVNPHKEVYTGITQVNAKAGAQQDAYDLSGRKALPTQKGVRIVNGKKALVK